MNHGTCRVCGAPLVAIVHKVQSRKDHPWGLTTWGSRLACSGSSGDLSQRLRCYFGGVEDLISKEIQSENKFFNQVSPGDTWQGGSIAVPFKGSGK